MKVSIYWLGQATGKHPATIKKRISNLDTDKRGKYDSGLALEAIYCGLNEVEGQKISTPEAVRLLTIAKKEEIDLDMEIKRGERLPRLDVELAHDEVFKSIAGTLKANANKKLTMPTINAIFGQFRTIGKELLNGHNGHD